MRYFPRFFAALLLAGLFAPAVWAADFSHSFTPEATGSGAATRLSYTIGNTGANPITGLAFTNILPAGVVLAEAPAISNSCMGSLTAPAGSDTITFAGGRLGANQTCQIGVYVIGTTGGVYNNVTGDLTGSDGNSGSSVASFTVDITRPSLALSVSPGGLLERGEPATLSYVFDNLTGGSPVFNLQFEQNLPDGIDLTATPVNTCSGILTNSLADDSFRLVGGFVAVGGSCSITAEVVATKTGIAEVVSSAATTNSNALGHFNTAVETTGFPVFVGKTFDPPQVGPGQTTSLTYTLSNANREASATDLTFSDDLDAALAGLTGTGTFGNNCGGSVGGTDLISVSGISLPPGGGCQITTIVQIPTNASTGSYPSTATQVSATTDGVPVSGNAPLAVLNVDTVPVLTKEFSTDVAATGSSVALVFTLANPGPDAITGFTLQEVIGGQFEVDGLPANGSCGAGSSFTLNTPVQGLTLNALNLSVAPNDSCTFTLDLRVPVSVHNRRAETGTDTAAYTNGAGQQISARVITDTLAVVSGVPADLSLDPQQVMPGAPVTLGFSLGAGPPGGQPIDLDEYNDYTAIAFTLDLDSALPGLSAVTLPQEGACGAGSSVTGSSLITLTGASLNAGETCKFDVMAQVPADAAPGGYTLIPSPVDATVQGLVAASTIQDASFSVSELQAAMEVLEVPVEIVSPNPASATLAFTIENTSSSLDATNIALQVPLDNSVSLTGLAAVGLPSSDVCGVGSSVVAASGSLLLTGGSVPAGTSCNFSVTLEIPADTPSGIYGLSSGPLGAAFDGTPATLPALSTQFEVLVQGEPRDLTPRHLNDPDPDVDGDGIATSVEEPLGDVNGDGFPDALQANVASLVSPVTGLPVALEFDPGCTLNNFNMVSVDSLPADGERQYPDGLAEFDLSCSESGITLHLPGGSLANSGTVRKYGPMAPNFADPPSWFTVGGVTIDEANDRFSFSLMDGELGDSTGIDGRLVDPVGFAVENDTDDTDEDGPVSIPVDNFWVLFMTSLMLLSIGVWTQRQRAR